MRIPHKGKNKGKYISFHYLRGWKARKIRKVQEISPQIPIYVEGEYTKKLSFSYKPQIKDVLNELQVENIYHFEETTQLASESVLYLPYGEHLISLNQASLEELMTLKGIGEKTAQKIIDYRQETPFKTIEDITNISGIGEKMYLKVREFLCL